MKIEYIQMNIIATSPTFMWAIWARLLHLIITNE